MNISWYQLWKICTDKEILDTFITIFGEDKLLDDLKHRRTSLSAKYKQLIDKHKLQELKNQKEKGVDDDF